MSEPAQLQDAEGRAADAARPVPSGTGDGLVLSHVSRVFPGGVVAVDDVNLRVDNGEYVVLPGPLGLRQDDDAADDRRP